MGTNANTASGVDWKESLPAIVITGLILLVVLTIFLAVYLKTGIEDALKAWAALAGLVGVVTGGSATYFFSRTTTRSLESQVEATDTTRKLVEDRLAELTNDAAKLRLLVHRAAPQRKAAIERVQELQAQLSHLQARGEPGAGER